MAIQGFVDDASNTHVILGATKIKSDYLTNGYLLPQTDTLVSNAVDAIKKHFDNQVPLSSLELSTYLAACSLSHTMDGWDYLSHSVDSLLKGDVGVAIHLAYYAELRATLSFLSSEGIGVFNRQHVKLDSSGSFDKCPGTLGTHEAAWELIDKWARSSITSVDNSVMQVFSVNGKTFEEWMAAFPYPSPALGRSVVRSWLREWNFDLHRFKTDRNMRNEVSYRPQRIKTNQHLRTLNDLVNSLASFWDVLEPNDSDPFQLLDKYLLRTILQKTYANLSSTIKFQNSFKSLIESTLENLGLNQSPSFVDFLTDAASQHLLFSESQKPVIDPATLIYNPLSVIARATLMLRLSTGMSSMVFRSAGVSKNDLSVVWDPYGIERGFWTSEEPPQTFVILWEDIKEHVSDLSEWANGKSPNLSLLNIYHDTAMPQSFSYFKQFNRAGLWGMSM